MAFLLKTRAKAGRSVQSRVFVSPFQSYERGETWQENYTSKLLWPKTSSEVQNWRVRWSIQVLLNRAISSTKLARDKGLLQPNWLELHVKSLPLKRTPSLRDDCDRSFKMLRMFKSSQVIFCGIPLPTWNTRYLLTFPTISHQRLSARFSIHLRRPAKRM